MSVNLKKILPLGLLAGLFYFLFDKKNVSSEHRSVSINRTRTISDNLPAARSDNGRSIDNSSAIRQSVRVGAQDDLASRSVTTPRGATRRSSTIRLPGVVPDITTHDNGEWRIFAAVTGDNDAAFLPNNSSFYTTNVFAEYESTGDFEAAHAQAEDGYYGSLTNGLDNIASDTPDYFASSGGGSVRWDSSTEIDHAVLFYDPSQTEFKTDVDIASAALRKHNPGIEIEVVEITSLGDVSNAFDSQQAFVENHAGRENVAVFYSGHGSDFGSDSSGDQQGYLKYLSEEMLEALQEKMKPHIDKGFTVIDACNSGLFVL